MRRSPPSASPKIKSLSTPTDIWMSNIYDKNMHGKHGKHARTESMHGKYDRLFS